MQKTEMRGLFTLEDGGEGARVRRASPLGTPEETGGKTKEQVSFGYTFTRMSIKRLSGLYRPS